MSLFDDNELPGVDEVPDSGGRVLISVLVPSLGRL